MLERWANSQGFALACSVGCVKGLGETKSDTHVMVTQLDSLVRSASWSLVPLTVPATKLGLGSPLMQLPASELPVQADRAVNLEFMTERRMEP